MTTLGDVLKAVRDVIVLNDRLVELTKRADRLEATQSELLQRMVRVETIVGYTMSGGAHTALPPGER